MVVMISTAVKSIHTVRPICAQIIPPRLCAMKMIGRVEVSGELLRPSKAFDKLLAWSLTRLVDTGDTKCATSASYPHVMMRASGMSLANRLYGQKTSSFFQVDTRPPPRPCTRHML